ncbi:MAG: AAA family ATPase [Clostridium sp.]|nr:AAA family ATPase [Clostridium sp.]
MKKASDIDISTIDTDSPEFQDALKLVTHTQQSVFLTGKAGTGKSTFLKYLTATTKKKFVVLAPTGIASVNAGGQTLHSFFKLPFKPILPNDPIMHSNSMLRDRMKYSKQHIKLIKELDLIIIDEVSMLRADIVDFIDRILRVYSGKQHAPFGGKQLLLVGDVFQLEPVITGDVRDVLCHFYADGFFFFNARAFSTLGIAAIELTKVYRQKDSDFIRMLDRVRVGSPFQEDIDRLNAKVTPQASLFDDQDFTMTIATRRDIVDNINQTHIDRLKTPERVFVGIIEGDFPESSLPTEKELTLKEGAQVVFVKNDPERRWVNGTIGRVAGFGEEDIIVELEDGKKHAVKIDTWDNVKYEYDEQKHKVTEKVLGSYMQYPLKLAWALTIHKSQGLTFDRVIVDVGQGAFSGGQTYVALSRCRSLQGIRLRSTINPRDVFVNPKVVAFSRTFNNNALIQRALEMAKADDLYSKSAALFSKGQYRDAINAFSEALATRNEMGRPAARRLLTEKVLSLAKAQSEVKELKDKIEEYEKKFLQLATEYVELAETCREEGWELDSAISNYDKAISLAPQYANAWIGRGKALAQMGEADKAVEAFRRAIELAPGDYRPLYECGVAQINAGDVAMGMDSLLHALQKNDKIAAVHLALADGYEMAGEMDEAEKHRRAAKKLNSKRKH